MVASSTYIGPGPLPKYRAGREPTTAGEFEGGQLVQAILTKAVFAYEKLYGDAILGSTMTSVLPSFWSWSRCTDMATFASCLGTPRLCWPPWHRRGNKDAARAGACLVPIIMAHVTRAS